MGRFSPIVGAYLGALDQINDLKELTDAIKSANDPPRTLEELQERVRPESENGYHDHHIAEEKAAKDAGFPDELIQGRDNLVRIPVLKHIDITSYYARKEDQVDGSRISPRELLRDMSFEERRQFGLNVLRKRAFLNEKNQFSRDCNGGIARSVCPAQR